MSKAISEIFNVDQPVTDITVSKTNEVVSSNNTTDELDSDSSKVRTNLKSLIDISEDALKNALDVAINSESPRAYEVVANLLNTAAELNTKLLDTHQLQNRVKAHLDKGANSPNVNTQNNTTNNVVFTGTPAELAKLLRNTNETI